MIRRRVSNIYVHMCGNLASTCFASAPKDIILKEIVPRLPISSVYSLRCAVRLPVEARELPGLFVWWKSIPSSHKIITTCRRKWCQDSGIITPSACRPSPLNLICAKIINKYLDDQTELFDADASAEEPEGMDVVIIVMAINRPVASRRYKENWRAYAQLCLGETPDIPADVQILFGQQTSLFKPDRKALANYLLTTTVDYSNTTQLLKLLLDDEYADEELYSTLAKGGRNFGVLQLATWKNVSRDNESRSPCTPLDKLGVFSSCFVCNTYSPADIPGMYYFKYLEHVLERHSDPQIDPDRLAPLVGIKLTKILKQMDVLLRAYGAEGLFKSLPTDCCPAVWMVLQKKIGRELFLELATRYGDRAGISGRTREMPKSVCVSDVEHAITSGDVEYVRYALPRLREKPSPCRVFKTIIESKSEEIAEIVASEIGHHDPTCHCLDKRLVSCKNVRILRAVIG